MKKLLLVLLLTLSGPEYALIASVGCKNLGADLLSWEVKWESSGSYHMKDFVRITVQCSDKIQVIVDYEIPIPVVQPRSSV